MILTIATGVLVIVGMLFAATIFNPAWNQCASDIGARIVEHGCGEGPPG